MSDTDSKSQQSNSLPKPIKPITHGDVVLLSKNRVAIVKYIGCVPELNPTSSSSSSSSTSNPIWYGVEIRMTEREMGNCSGKIGNKKYFKCAPNLGMFLRLLMIERRISAKELLEKVIKATKSKQYIQQLLQQSMAAQNELKLKVKELRRTMKKLRRKLRKTQQSLTNVTYDMIATADETETSLTFTPRGSITCSTPLDLSLIRSTLADSQEPAYITGVISPSINEKRHSLQVIQRHDAPTLFTDLQSDESHPSLTPSSITVQHNQVFENGIIDVEESTPNSELVGKDVMDAMQAMHALNMQSMNVPASNPLLSTSISSPLCTDYATIEGLPIHKSFLPMAIPMKARNIEHNKVRIMDQKRRAQSSPQIFRKLSPNSYENRCAEISKWTTNDVIEWLSTISKGKQTFKHTDNHWNYVKSIFLKYKISGKEILQLTDNFLIELKIDINEIRYHLLFEREQLFCNSSHLQFPNIIDIDSDGNHNKKPKNLQCTHDIADRKHSYTQSQKLVSRTPRPSISPPALYTSWNDLHFDELISFYNSIDANNDGLVCIRDWTSIMVDLCDKFDFVLDQNDIISTFNEFDLDSTGIVSKEEFIVVMGKIYLRAKALSKSGNIFIRGLFITMSNHIMRKIRNMHIMGRNSYSTLKDRNGRKSKSYSKHSGNLPLKLKHGVVSCRLKAENFRKLSINNRSSNRNKNLKSVRQRRHYVSQSTTNSPSLSMSYTFSRSESCSQSRSRPTPLPPPRNGVQQKIHLKKRSSRSSKPRPPPPRMKSNSNV